MDKKIYKNQKIDEEMFFYESESGLRVYLVPKKGYMKKHAVFATKYGSNDNKFIPIGKKEMIEVPEGIAHFLEHKLFEEPDENIFDQFSKFGASVNAYTNFNQTAYLFSCTDNFYESLELLIKFVQNPYFTDENVDKEKGIIAQEIKMYEDSPGWKVFFNCLTGMYHNHPVKIDIAGTVESIQKIDKETLYTCYNTFYHPKNMVLFLVGDISFDEVIKVVEKSEKKDIKNNIEEITRIYSEEPKEIKEKYIEENLVTSIPIFTIGFKDDDVGLDGKKLVKKEIATNILLDMLFGRSSKFYQELYNEGLVDSSFGGQYIGHKSYGHSIIAGQSYKPEIVLEKTNLYLENMRNKGLNKEDFERIKKKNIGSNIMGFNSIDFIANNFINYLFLDFSFIDYIDLYDSISFDDISNRFNNHYRKDNYTLSVVKPV
ncbi:insulinase family protein [Anaerosalibacter massiliensis]|uniref:Insulinase family protein n=1 Tax=Anaerosalibacter massiliensis TaxID=1347392 RepID=A0A9X2S5T0_9FIRM|nr:pitrilysin family protein [Anaerosalibacter massiliensis]MCR2042902.1 insulinase family protein [Anaerosalibacter massiliensis]